VSVVSIEEIEGRDLLSVIRMVKRARTDQARLKHAVTLSESAMPASARRCRPARGGESGSQSAATLAIPPGTRPERLSRNADKRQYGRFWVALKDAPGVYVARADLFSAL
jgi:hypothetical protein